MEQAADNLALRCTTNRWHAAICLMTVFHWAKADSSPDSGNYQIHQIVQNADRSLSITLTGWLHCSQANIWSQVEVTDNLIDIRHVIGTFPIPCPIPSADPMAPPEPEWRRFFLTVTTQALVLGTYQIEYRVGFTGDSIEFNPPFSLSDSRQFNLAKDGYLTPAAIPALGPHGWLLLTCFMIFFAYHTILVKNRRC